MKDSSSLCIQTPCSYEKISGRHQKVFNYSNQDLNAVGLRSESSGIICPTFSNAKKELQNFTAPEYKNADSAAVRSQQHYFKATERHSTEPDSKYDKNELKHARETVHQLGETVNLISSNFASDVKQCFVSLAQLTPKLLSKCGVIISQRDYKKLFKKCVRLEDNKSNPKVDLTVSNRNTKKQCRTDSTAANLNLKKGYNHGVMQEAFPWYTPTSSALHNNVNEDANYFHDYYSEYNSNVYNSPYGSYYPNPQMSNMRTCGETTRFGTDHSGAHCPPMLFKQEIIEPDSSTPVNGRDIHANTQNNQKRYAPINFRNGNLKSNLKSVGYNPNAASYSNVDPRPPKLDRGDPANATQNIEFETDNFSSVFTKSLTSLYSQDTDSNFAEEKNFKSPVIDVGDNDGVTDRLNGKPDSGRLANGNTEYSFSSMFEIEDNHFETEPIISTDKNCENVFSRDSEINQFGSKIKSEPYTSGSTYRYDGFSMDDMHLQRRPNPSNRGGRFSRKRKHSVPALPYRSGFENDGNETKSPGHAFEWTPNSLSSHRNDGRLTDTYRPPDCFAENNTDFNGSSGFEKIKTPRQYRMSFRTRADKNDEKTNKKISKKISPLSVYAKVHDGTIIEVKCRRFKKRTKSCNVEIGKDAISNNTHNNNRMEYVEKHPSLENVSETATQVLREIVDKISNSNFSKDHMDMFAITPSKAKELLLKFCHDYSLDSRDFTNIQEIIRAQVIGGKDEIIERKRKRQRTFSADKPSSEIIKERRTHLRRDRLRKHNDGTVEHRVLRSLPSRQSPRHSRKCSSKRIFLKRRYPKRNLKNKNSDRTIQKKLKIVIDLSKEMESDISLAPSNLSVGNRSETVENDLANVNSSDESGWDQRRRRKESTKTIAKGISDTEADSVITVSDDDTTTTVTTTSSRNQKQTNSDAPSLDINVQSEKEESPRLREPPQLVRMKDPRKIFLSEQQKDMDEANSRDDHIDVERLSPSYMTANGLEPCSKPPSLDRSPMHPRRSSGESNCNVLHPMDSDDSDGELVIDLEDKETKGNHISSKYDEVSSTTSLPALKADPPEVADSMVEENFSEDDCIVISAKNDQEAAIKSDDKLYDATASESKDDRSNDLSSPKEQFLDAPNSKNSPRDVCSDENISNGALNLKSCTKDDRDESILRTLLLESGEMVSNSNSSTGQDITNPVITNVVSLVEVKSASPPIIDSVKLPDSPCLTPSFSKEEDSILRSADSIKLPKYQSYHDTYPCESPTGEFDVQKLCNIKEKPSPPPPLQPDNANSDETKEPLLKDPQQLKEKIKKLKGEIVYLQLMAEQKEKEKIAIVCFKRYKEEILKRIYKAYAFSVQDHVRDWIFARRENAGENRSGDSRSQVPGNAHKMPSQNSKDSQARMSDPTRNFPDSFREDNSYPRPTPAHAHSSPSYFSKMHHKPVSHGQQPIANRRSPQQCGEKLPAVETMVAKATENYGVDMRHLRENNLQSSSDASVSGTILQKVLSSKDASRNSSPDFYHHSNSWSPDQSRHKNSSSGKSVPPLVPKVYPEQYIPLDVILSPTSGRSPNSESRSTKTSEFYRSSPEVSTRTSQSFHTKERSQIQALLSEPVQSKTGQNPYRSWSIQSGGRINETRPDGMKGASSSSTQGSTGSPLQRALISQKSGGGQQAFAMPSAMKAPPNYNANSHAPIQDYKDRSLRGNVDGNYSHKSNEVRRPLVYSSMLSSNSAMPYGGHLVSSENGSSTAAKSSSNTPIPSTAATATAVTTTRSNVNSSSNSPLCMGCSLSHAKFLCSGCRKHWYCSAECQSLRWPEHSLVCAGSMYSQAPTSYS